MESVIIWDCSSYALQTSVIRPENSRAILFNKSDANQAHQAVSSCFG